MSGFEHQACVYGSDEDFLAMAVPFVRDGAARGEPVLITTTPHNLELIADAVGEPAGTVDIAETAYFGRRPAERVAEFHGYWRRASGGGAGQGSRPVRILAEPVWAGRSRREVLAWKRMESGLNTVLAGTGIWMICPYDSRSCPPDVLADALRTHPAVIEGTTASASGGFVDPAEFARECDSAPLPPPPPEAAEHRFGGRLAGDLAGVRRFVAGAARALGLGQERSDLLVAAAAEVAARVRRDGGGATVRVWERFGAVLCEFHAPGGRIDDPFCGLRPPSLDASPDDGLWVVRRLCDVVELRSDETGRRYRLEVPGPRSLR